MEYLLLYKFMECYIGISVPTFFHSYGHTTLFIPFSLTVSNEDQQQEEIFLFDAAKSTWLPWKADQN